MPLLLPLLVGVLLFAIGVYGVLARRNAVLVLVGVELMLNAVNLNLLAFDAWHRDALHSGQILALFVITIAAAEIGLGLAIVLLLFRTRASVDVEAARELADRDATDEAYAEEPAAVQAAASAAAAVQAVDAAEASEDGRRRSRHTSDTSPDDAPAEVGR
jgi:NADH-quinone oxidoreductase subunit K